MRLKYHCLLYTSYWKDFTAFAAGHGIEHIALELHPGQMCYNPETVKRLRADVGSDLIGVNLDFSHLLWQRMDPILVTVSYTHLSPCRPSCYSRQRSPP